MAKNQVNRSRSEWEEIIRQCKSSGLSDRQWCQDNGVPLSSFYVNLRKFRNVTLEDQLPVKQVAEEVHEIIPLTIRGDFPEDNAFSQDAAARITLQGIRIELYNGADEKLICSLLQAAGTLC